jgi:thiosulfate reductase cytochrome b subunit
VKAQAQTNLGLKGRIVLKLAHSVMAETAYLPGPAIREASQPDSSRHSLLVRVTHWLNTISFVALVVSGFAIILAHPRFYWGETGGVGTPSLFDLPLPFMLGGPSGWGRYMHFQAAWLCVLTGLLYLISGLLSRHFRNNLWPAKGQLSWNSLSREIRCHLRFSKPSDEEAYSYNVLQRLSYLAVIFLLFPLMIWTGMAMSPAVTSVFPSFVTSLGGQETARTIHFLAANLLLLFLLVHVAMIFLAGFVARTRAMITGRVNGGKELP